MRKRRRSGFFTFIFSLMPGAAEMYMGFMKNGMSIMGLFFLSFIVPSVLRTSDVFILFAGLIWFFAFLHARNLASCDNETLQTIEDRFVWEEYLNGHSFHIPDRILRTWGAGILILYGVLMLWDSFTNLILCILPEWMLRVVEPVVNQVPQAAVALLIITIGLRLIRGKKEAIEEKEDYVEYREDRND